MPWRITERPEYTREQTIVFDLTGEGFTIETLCGGRTADVGTVALTFVRMPPTNDLPHALTMIVINARVDDVEYVERRPRDAGSIHGPCEHVWLNQLVTEGERIASGDEGAW